jgi:hypothetical protein
MFTVQDEESAIAAAIVRRNQAPSIKNGSLLLRTRWVTPASLPPKQRTYLD